MTDDQRDRFTFDMGPLSLDYAGFIRFRINEHVLHSRDIAVAFDPTAALSADGAGVVLESLPTIALLGGKPTGSTRELSVHTTSSDRHVLIRLSVDGVPVDSTDSVDTPHLELPAEVFTRLVYGASTQPTPRASKAQPKTLELRRAFPGI